MLTVPEALICLFFVLTMFPSFMLCCLIMLDQTVNHVSRLLK